jgi:hypothetical protein
MDTVGHDWPIPAARFAARLATLTPRAVGSLIDGTRVCSPKSAFLGACPASRQEVVTYNAGEEGPRGAPDRAEGVWEGDGAPGEEVVRLTSATVALVRGPGGGLPGPSGVIRGGG